MAKFTFPAPLVAVSVGANRMLGNKTGWPVCSSLYEHKLKGSKLACLAVKTVDVIFWWDHNHCYRSWRKSKLMRNSK